MPAFSLAALTALDLAPPRLIDVASVCGFEKVGLRLLAATPGGISYPLMTDRSGMKETKARMAATGIKVADLEIVAFRPETVASSFEAFLEAGRELGARHTLVAGYDPDLSRFADRFAEYCELADRYGLTADLEFMPWTEVPDLNIAARIVEKVSSPAAGILIDALHFARSGSRLEDLRKSLRGGCITGRCATHLPSVPRRWRGSFTPHARNACFPAKAVSASWT